MADRNPYDDLLQQDTAQALRTSMSSVVDRQPDAEARLQTLARDYNMPVEAVRMRQPEIERTARLASLDYDTLARQYPKTAGTLTDPARAAIAHDDVDNMTTIERIGGGLVGTAKYIFSAPDSRNTLAGDIGAGMFLASRGAAGLFRAGTEVLAPTLDVFERPDIGSPDRAPVPFVADLPGGNPLRRLAEGFGEMGRQAGAMDRELSPPTNDIVQGGVSGGVKSLVQNTLSLPLLFLPGGQAAYFTNVIGNTGGQSYQTAREKGIDTTTSLVYGASDAAIEYATEKLPVARLLGDLKAGAPLMQTLLRNAALEVPGEQVATVLQDLNEWAVINPDKPFSSYLEERPAAAAQTLIATLIGVGGNVAVGKVLESAIGQAAEGERDATRAEAHAKVLGELVALAEASKVRERDPASFATFMQSLTEEGVPNVYVDAKALMAADLQEIAAVLPSVAEQFSQAAATGGDVVIPTAELLTAGPGQAFMQTLLDNARTAPDAMSPVEAREYMQTKGDQLQADIAKVLEDKSQDQQWQTMRDQLRDEFKGQLDGVKRFTADVNLQYANLLANFYSVTAAKLGTTPQELATRYGLRVQSKGVEGGQVLDQGPRLYAVRAEPTGKISPITRKPIFELFDGEGRRIGLSHSYETVTAAVEGHNTPKQAAPATPTYSVPEPELPPRSNWKQTRGESFTALDDDDGFLYHVTAAPNAKGIREAGLTPGGRNTFGGVYEAYSSGKVFLTERSGVSFWKSRVEDQLQHNSDNPPKVVVMRIPKDLVKVPLAPDDIGTKDARARAYYSTETLYQSTPLPATLNIDGKDRPTTNSNGQPIAQTEEGVQSKGVEGGQVLDQEARRVSLQGDRLLLDGRDVGLAEVLPQTRAGRGGVGLEISRLYVDPEYQRRGVGGALIDTLFASHPDAGFIDVYPGGRSDAFWLRQGVESVDDEGYMRITRESRAARTRPTRRLNQSAPLPATLNIDGKDRPTTNSNGQPIAQTEEGVRNFWKWFGDSKVVDDQGRPLVVYHGTRAQFEVFDFGRIGQQGRAEGAGFYFTTNSQVAAGYGEPMQVYLSVQKPLAYGAKGFSPAVLQKIVKRIAELEAQAEGMEVGDGFLANFGDVYTDGLDKVVKSAARLIGADETALDQLSGIVGSGVNPEHVNRATIEVAGFDGVVADGFSDSGDAQNRIFVAFTPEQIKSATGNSGEFDPANPSILRQEARGSINLPDDLTRSPAILSLFKGADLSTFIHESGHFFLEVQMDLAARIQAQIDEGATVSEGERSIIEDANKLLAWFGVKGDETRTALAEWATMGLETKRPHHEQFARGFEAYAFEGNAPSLELQGMFSKFRAWLLSVYKELKALRVELTDDVRGVMDRMLASTQAIQEAEAARRLGPLFKTAEDAGMSLDEFKAYHALATDASQAAIEELQARGLRDMKWLQGAKDRKLKELQKLHDSLRREVRAEVRREVMAQPVYRAWQFLTGKGEADETAQPADKPKASKELDVIDDDLLTAIAKLGGLNKDQAVKVWGIDPKEKPDSGVFGTPVLRTNGGLSIDALGERLLEAGYLLPDENGRHDNIELEEKFNAALRGESVYSMWHDYRNRDDEPVQPLPDRVAFGKLDPAELERRYGSDQAAPWRKLQKLRMTSGNRGIHPDVVAETVGMESGDQMVKALLDAEPPQSVIEGMTDQRMLERFGDLGTPEGLQRAVDRAIHNEARARFLSTEIAALERGMQVRADTGRTGANGQRITVDVMAQVARQQAERIVGGTKVKNLRPSQYTTAETRAAKAAERAMLEGKTEEALAEKRHQLINLQAARAAARAQEEVEKITSYLRRFADKPKGLDADYYDQIAQLLVRFDLANSTTLKQIAKRKTLAAWVESQREQGLEPDIPPELLDEAGRTSYKDMTVDELRGLRDTVRQIEKLGRVKNTLLTAKQLRDFQAARDLIADNILANAGGRVADTRTPATRTARWFKAVKDFGAAHIKAATWARVFDGGKDGGPVWEYFIRPANEAADMETRMRAEATEKLHAILAPVIKAGRMDGKGKFFATINRSMNREQVFAMALNMGNEGNLQRMLDGEGWTVQQIQPVLATLSSADWQAVQAVWDHFESYRPLVGAKERRIYGKEPAWVEPMPFSVQASDGTTVPLRGGYYPVKYDPLANNRAEQHADAEDAKRQMQAAYTSATTRRGFTKSRAEAVKGRPLLYSLAAVYSGTQDVIHDLAFHEWLIDANKLLRSDKINDAIRETYGPSAVRQLKTWIEDTARGEQGLQAEMDSMLGRLRQGVSLAGLGFNVMSAALQPVGLTQSVVRVGGKWIGRGVAQYLSNPLAKAREVNERSEFMASRARTRFRELNELRNQVEGEHPVRTWTSNAAFYFMTRMQMVVDVPTWLGAYEKAISEGNSDERAGQLADQAVIDSQGGGQMKDLSAIERGGPAQKLFTVFYSFMNTALNAGVAQTMTEKSRAKLAADYLLLYSVPAVLTAALKDALMPGDSGDWEDLEGILRKLAEAQLDMLFGLMVGVRELAGAAKMAAGLSEYGQDYQGPAGLRLLADITGLAEQVGQGELDDTFRKRAINVIGSGFGLPAAQVNRSITGANALLEGETSNPAALAFGYQRP